MGHLLQRAKLTSVGINWGKRDPNLLLVIMPLVQTFWKTILTLVKKLGIEIT